MADLPIKITATNQASPVLQRVKQDVAGLDNTAGKAAGGLSALGKAAGVAGIAAFGVQVGQAALEMAKLGAQSLALKSSFEQVQGGAANAASVLDALRSASRGMIGDYDLMLSANKAALLGVADTAKEMSALLQIASVRGRAMGISATQAFSDIVTGLGRMSPLILDNLGITVNLEDTMKRYAETLGKTSDALTDTERKQALVNAVIESSSSLMDDANKSAETLAGQGFAQLDTAWGNFKTAIGESLAPFFDARAKEIADFIKTSTEELNRVTEAENLRIALQGAGAPSTAAMLAGITDQGTIDSILKNQGRTELAGIGDSVNTALETYQGAIDRFIEAAKSGNSEATQAAITSLQMYGDAVRELGEKYNAVATILGRPTFDLTALENGRAVLEGYEKIYDALPGAIRPTAEELAAVGQSLSVATQGTSEFTKSFEEAARILGEAEPKLKGIYDTLLDTGDIEGASKAYGQIQGIIQEITAEWIRAGVPIEEIESTLLPKLLSELDTLVGKQVDAGAAGITAGADMSSGFLSAIPAIQLVIQAVGALIGVAGEASAAVGKATETGVTSYRLKGRRPSVGFADGNPFDVAPTMGRAPSDGGTSVGIVSGVAELMRKLPFERMRPLGITGGVGDSYGGSSSGGGGNVDSTLNQLAGKVKSVLSGALKSGIDLSSILPREDAVEEPARRLADIAVRGFDSPWTEYIRTTFPEIFAQLSSSGDPKAAAAGILKDFEAGLRPELLDKGKAKELVKRALLGDANMTQLANEIAAELSAEMGISLEDAQAAAASALGTGTGTGGVGASFGDGVVTGVKDGNVGGRAVAALVTQLEVKDNLTAVYNAGQSHGAQYGSGFLATVGTNLPGGLVAILIAAVTPGVLANVNAQGGRTGATGADGSAGWAI
jgi:hypothetical protein